MWSLLVPVICLCPSGVPSGTQVLTHITNTAPSLTSRSKIHSHCAFYKSRRNASVKQAVVTLVFDDVFIGSSSLYNVVASNVNARSTLRGLLVCHLDRSAARLIGSRVRCLAECRSFFEQCNKIIK